MAGDSLPEGGSREEWGENRGAGKTEKNEDCWIKPFPVQMFPVQQMFKFIQIKKVKTISQQNWKKKYTTYLYPFVGIITDTSGVYGYFLHHSAYFRYL